MSKGQSLELNWLKLNFLGYAYKNYDPPRNMAPSELSIRIPQITESQLISLISRASGVPEPVVNEYVNGISLENIDEDSIINIAKIANSLTLNISDLVSNENMNNFTEKALLMAQKRGILKDKKTIKKRRRSDESSVQAGDGEETLSTAAFTSTDCIVYYLCVALRGESECKRPSGC